MELNRKTIRVILGIITFGVLISWSLEHTKVVKDLLRLLIGLISPFLVGGAIAFILNIPMKAIEKHLFPKSKRPLAQNARRPLAILLTLLAVVSVLALIALIVAPEIGATVRTLVDRVPRFLEQTQAKAMRLFAENETVVQYLSAFTVNWQELLTSLFGFLQNGAGSLVSGTVGAASSIANGFINFFIGFIFAIYVLSQREKLTRQTKMLLYAWLPEKWADRLCRVGTLACKTFSNFFSGQLLEACILGFLFVVAMTIFRMPYAVLIGVLIAFTALIPVFGAFVGCGVGAFLILVQNPIQALWFVVLFIVLQQLEGNLIYPKVVGSSVGLPSIWVLAAVSVGGGAMGVIGMLIMIPLCSVTYALLREAVYARLKKRGIPKEKLSDQTPLPASLLKPKTEKPRPGVRPLFKKGTKHPQK